MGTLDTNVGMEVVIPSFLSKISLQMVFLGSPVFKKTYVGKLFWNYVLRKSIMVTVQYDEASEYVYSKIQCSQHV